MFLRPMTLFILRQAQDCEMSLPVTSLIFIDTATGICYIHNRTFINGGAKWQGKDSLKFWRNTASTTVRLNFCGIRGHLEIWTNRNCVKLPNISHPSRIPSFRPSHHARPFLIPTPRDIFYPSTSLRIARCHLPWHLLYFVHYSICHADKTISKSKSPPSTPKSPSVLSAVRPPSGGELVDYWISNASKISRAPKKSRQR